MLNTSFAEHPVYTVSSLNISCPLVKETKEHEVATVASRKRDFVR